MSWQDYFFQFGLTIFAVIVGFAMGRTTREEPKRDTNNPRTSHPGDTEK